MTTTRAFQSRPDSYMSRKDCEAAGKQRKQQTNPRYSNFKQSHFTAGDEEQFQAYRDATNGDVCIPEIDITGNLFADQPFPTWYKYKDVGAAAVVGTFRYIFNKFKKGIFVKIKGNKVVVFLPFSKASFTNEWSSHIHVDPQYRDLDDFLKRFTGAGYTYNPRSVNKNVNEWYANNCIVRYDINPYTRRANEGDTNVSTVKNMLEVLCANRVVPDIEFFMNRRDFPLLTRDGTEPYDNIWGDMPLVSYDLPKYIPILSMCKTDRYADILVPTHEDWARVQSLNSIWFPRNCKGYNEVFDTPWKDKKNTAVFRGASTGCGVTIETNPRLKLAYIASQHRDKEGDEPLLDAGITKWNLRPRKLKDARYLQSIDVSDLNAKGVKLVNYLSLQEQEEYRYIINLDGHVSAFRLSIELGMGSVILLVDSKWKLWYSDMLIPYQHYVPVKSDLSNLVKQIQWCRDNEKKCQEIVANSTAFYNTYIQEKGILDYLQKTLVDMKDEVGVYLYNERTPLSVQLEEERESLSLAYPTTGKGTADVNEIPWFIKRGYGLLQGVHWIINLALHKQELSSVINKVERIFSNKLGVIHRYMLGSRERAQFSVAVKATTDPGKAREHVHDAFVGTKAINPLIKHIPNFAYTFGLQQDSESNVSVINEFIHGRTLFDYLGSHDFRFDDFLFIMAQVCLSIQVAQNRCGLVHYDLMPWNIILLPSQDTTVDYVLDHSSIIRLRTDVVPVIIDYGKSHVIVDQKHHGFINMFKVSTIQDMLSLLLNSISIIREKQKLERTEFINMLRLADFVTGTKYRRERFTRAQDLKEFLRQAIKYSTMAYGPKYELEERTPMDLLKWILKIGHGSKYGFMRSMKKVKNNLYSMDRGNGRQIFEYILSDSTEERAQTYFNVFARLKHCTVPQPKNLFFVYYAVQVLVHNLGSVKDEMDRFLAETGGSRPKTEPPRRTVGAPIALETYTKAYEDSLQYLTRVYRPKIEKMTEEEVEYKMVGDFSILQLAPYTQESFLEPVEMGKILKNLQGTPAVDLSKYQEIITSILLNEGPYELSKENRQHYLRNFSKILETNPLNMQNNTANLATLEWLLGSVYYQDRSKLASELPGEGNCLSAQRYLKEYASILELLK
jgi:hypothetical protein